MKRLFLLSTPFSIFGSTCKLLKTLLFHPSVLSGSNYIQFQGFSTTLAAKMDYEPPFLQTYKALLLQNSIGDQTRNDNFSVVESCELPLIDIGRLNLGNLEREKCIKEINEAARQWGFFQVVNHGISEEFLERLQSEQRKIFRQPFEKKSAENFLNMSAKSYRWGNPFATNPRQISWSEAFHMSVFEISSMDRHESLRSTMGVFAGMVAHLVESLAEILAQELKIKSRYFQENCSPNSSFLRLNRYPPCPFPSRVFGLVPHSDSSFLTIVYQDRVGGLQLMKDGKWVAVKPNPNALIVNIGDLFQAMSNGIYKSIKHRVVAADKVDRFSVAYFYCPTNDSVIESHGMPKLYKNFTFRDYKLQSDKDVKETGDKVGLPRFLR